MGMEQEGNRATRLEFLNKLAPQGRLTKERKAGLAELGGVVVCMKYILTVVYATCIIGVQSMLTQWGKSPVDWEGQDDVGGVPPKSGGAQVFVSGFLGGAICFGSDPNQPLNSFHIPNSRRHLLMRGGIGMRDAQEGKERKRFQLRIVRKLSNDLIVDLVKARRDIPGRKWAFKWPAAGNREVREIIQESEIRSRRMRRRKSVIGMRGSLCCEGMDIE
ncbi:hypothetical protein BDK51DRAFT_35403 [Blyttiomyces helicus]|uniref:Uncharacterized protein n=1 Tax=Blyttiomyces helicus TaxID=388810 RepID=A0A4P9W830_9FUNG|nr:hypothetical protein BDK51DRAFT_35403 [Blyttiomyces helicus]|eukprot:RKO87583.1 hypothetical protein BDK51DRAFT_35403 [Blyttiomyces helicus]